ncbi:MAG: hypothetical protein ACD_12C00699G0002 [uncultured bacterium]|nr:MAG: hypothetical protein ACD_12C00699G0002 [uncultured bacterium]
MQVYNKEISTRYYFDEYRDPRITDLFQTPTYGCNKNNYNAVDHTWRFITTNCTILDPFLNKLIGSPLQTGDLPPTVAIVNLAKKIHEEDRRKMTGEMYIKHLFYTAYLVDEMTKEKEYSFEQQNLATAVAFLHDTIELKRKRIDTADYDVKDFYNLLMTTDVNGSTLLNNWEPKNIKKISIMVSLMTPPDKSIETPADEWHNIKREDFYFLMNITKEQVRERNEMSDLDRIQLSENDFKEMAQIIRDVKIAEVLANLRETADDVMWSRDGHDNFPDMRDFKDRHQMFKERIQHFGSLSLNELYVAQMDADMQILNDFVGG